MERGPVEIYWDQVMSDLNAELENVEEAEVSDLKNDLSRVKSSLSGQEKHSQTELAHTVARTEKEARSKLETRLNSEDIFDGGWNKYSTGRVDQSRALYLASLRGDIKTSPEAVVFDNGSEWEIVRNDLIQKGVINEEDEITAELTESQRERIVEAAESYEQTTYKATVYKYASEGDPMAELESGKEENVIIDSRNDPNSGEIVPGDRVFVSEKNQMNETTLIGSSEGMLNRVEDTIAELEMEIDGSKMLRLSDDLTNFNYSVPVVDSNGEYSDQLKYIAGRIDQTPMKVCELFYNEESESVDHRSINDAREDLKDKSILDETESGDQIELSEQAERALLYYASQMDNSYNLARVKENGRRPEAFVVTQGDTVQVETDQELTPGESILVESYDPRRGAAKYVDHI